MLQLILLLPVAKSNVSDATAFTNFKTAFWIEFLTACNG